MNACVKCEARVEHPWHDNGTENTPDMIRVIESYINHLESAGDNHDIHN